MSRDPYDYVYELFSRAETLKSLRHMNARDFTEAILVAFGLDKSAFSLGISKVFFRPNKAEFMQQIIEVIIKFPI